MNDQYYVIPDIHGTNSLLQKALTKIYADNPDGGKIIFLGDYVDRGSDNRGVIETVMRPPENWEFVCLKGNHEEMFVDSYMRNDRFYDPKVTLEWVDTIMDTSEFPRHIIEWMDGLKSFHFEDSNVFAHAHYDGYCLPEDQNTHACVWRRYQDSAPFFVDERLYPNGLYLTHGHTPRPNGPISSPNRMNLDCAAFHKTGKLVVGIYTKDVKGPINFLEFYA